MKKEVKVVKIPPGSAPREIRAQWMRVVLPLATEEELEADPPSENGIGDANEGGYIVLRERAVEALRVAGRSTAAQYWGDFVVGKYLVFRKDCCSSMW